MNNPNLDLTEETRLLGGLIRDPKFIQDVADVVGPEDLYLDANQRVYRALLAMAERSAPIDLPLVGAVLQARGELLTDVKPTHLAELWNSVATGHASVYYAQKVKGKALLRRLERAGREIAHKAAKPDADWEHCLAQAEKCLAEVLDKSVSDEDQFVGDSMGQTLAKIDELSRGEPEKGLVPLGLTGLDRLLAGGLRPGELVLVAARPGLGKSAFALTVARNVAWREGPPVLLASIEMKKMEINQRLLAIESGVPLQTIRRGMLLDEEISQIAEAASRIKRYNRVLVSDGGTQTLTQLAAKAWRLKRRQGLAMVIVDYLQLVETEDRKLPRYEQVGSISRRLKALAKDLDCPVLALAQLNREVENRERPRLSDLRESGSLEQDANAVILLHKGEIENTIDAIVAKNRNGPQGTITLSYEAQYTRFGNFGYSGGENE